VKFAMFMDSFVSYVDDEGDEDGTDTEDED
jgi:hypothetical protein